MILLVKFVEPKKHQFRIMSLCSNQFDVEAVVQFTKEPLCLVLVMHVNTVSKTALLELPSIVP